MLPPPHIAFAGSTLLASSDLHFRYKLTSRVRPTFVSRPFLNNFKPVTTFVTYFHRPAAASHFACTVSSRQIPSCHSSCHSTHAHSHALGNTESTSNRITAILTKIASLRSSVRAATASTIFLFLSAALYVIRLPIPLLYRLPLVATLSLSGLPAVADSSLSVMRNRSAALNVDVLMTLAALISVITGAFFEAALLTTLYAVSLAAERNVSARAAAQLNDLRRTSPDTALQLTSLSSEPQRVTLESVVPGDLLLIQVGQMAPCDGIVENAPALVSVAHLTGESVPITKDVGDAVQAGTCPQDAPLIIRVTHTGAESFLARISRLVTEGQQNRPQIARFFERFGAFYTRCVLAVSFAVAALLPLMGSSFNPSSRPVSFTGRNGSIMRGLGLLVVASPCALLIGAPIAYTAALSACARRGVLVKGGARALDAAAVTSHVIFDKTGTLTTGKLQLTNTHVVPTDNDLERLSAKQGHKSEYLTSLERGSDDCKIFGNGALPEDEFVRVVNAAAALERGSVHPIADAIRQKAQEVGGEVPSVVEAKVVAGQGVEGSLTFKEQNHSTLISGKLGRPSFILKVDSVAFRSVSEEAALHGETVSVLQVADRRFLLRMKDDIRPEAREVVEELKRAGLQITVLTGDANGAANFVSDAVGGNVNVIANATPVEKMKFVEELGRKLQDDGKGVLMVGDGVNDGAALAAALIGIAFGLSNATAADAAEVVLVREDLRNLTWFLRKAQATGHIVKENLAIAFGLMIASGAACVFGGLPLWLAVMLHEGGTILVGINGLRLLRDG